MAGSEPAGGHHVDSHGSGRGRTESSQKRAGRISHRFNGNYYSFMQNSQIVVAVHPSKGFGTKNRSVRVAKLGVSGGMRETVRS